MMVLTALKQVATAATNAVHSATSSGGNHHHNAAATSGTFAIQMAPCAHVRCCRRVLRPPFSPWATRLFLEGGSSLSRLHCRNSRRASREREREREITLRAGEQQIKMIQ